MAQALGGLLVLVTVWLIGGCQEAMTVAAPQEPPEVQVTPVVQQDVPLYSEWVGTTVGYVTAQIRARITGYLMSQQYTEGAFVKAGDLLFRIDPRPYQASRQSERRPTSHRRRRSSTRAGPSSPKRRPRSSKPRPRSPRPWPP